MQGPVTFRYLMTAQVVDFGDWLKLDQAEVERGAALGKAREKFVDQAEMIRVVHGPASASATMSS